MFASQTLDSSRDTSAFQSLSISDSFADTDDLNSALSLGSSSESSLESSLQPTEAVTAQENSNPLFSDTATIVADFNGDGKTDRFWRNSQTGETAVWLMDGTKPTAELLPTKVDSSWDFAYADFNRDGKTDIFWHNKTTGENAIWLMDGTKVSSEVALEKVDSSWT
ncbi:MAG: FG-GAP repeat domain-containing protein, partial [Brasilonema sp.]